MRFDETKCQKCGAKVARRYPDKLISITKLGRLLGEPNDRIRYFIKKLNILPTCIIGTTQGYDYKVMPVLYEALRNMQIHPVKLRLVERGKEHEKS